MAIIYRENIKCLENIISGLDLFYSGRLYNYISFVTEGVSWNLDMFNNKHLAFG